VYLQLQGGAPKSARIPEKGEHYLPAPPAMLSMPLRLLHSLSGA
jgi:hypothetical protein